MPQVILEGRICIGVNKEGFVCNAKKNSVFKIRYEFGLIVYNDRAGNSSCVAFY